MPSPGLDTRATTRVLDVLRTTPYLLPPRPQLGERTISVIVQFDPAGAVRLQPVPDADAGSLGFDRALAARRTRLPDYWLLVFDRSVKRVVYWAPLDDPRRLRLEPEVHSGRTPPTDPRLIAGVTVVRLPDVRGATIGLFASNVPGRVAASPAPDPARALSSIRLDPAELAPQFPCTCPQVWGVRGNPQNLHGLDILFIGDGFKTDEELETYRCIVSDLANDLLDHPPFKQFACRINILRIDTPSEQSGISVADDCGASCTTQMSTLVRTNCPLGSQLPPHSTCPQTTSAYGTHHCEAGLCSLVWPSPNGVDAAYQLATGCVPKADVIVLVANSTTLGGGGAVPTPSTPGLVVVTLYGLQSGTAWKGLAHELGHVFGLLDETNLQGPGNIPYECRRNVYSTLPPQQLGCLDGVTWSGLCDDPPDDELCDGQGPIGGCHRVVACPLCPVQPVIDIGLHEGAFYEACNYYRPREACRMFNRADDFCPVCERWIRKVASDSGWCACGRPCPQEFAELLITGRGRLSAEIPPPTPARPERPPRPTFTEVSNLTARVELDGIAGEVLVREIRATLKLPSQSRLKSTSRLVGRLTYDATLSWTLGGTPLSPGPSLSLGRLTRPRRMQVVDAMQDRVWWTTDVSWQESPDLAASEQPQPGANFPEEGGGRSKSR